MKTDSKDIINYISNAPEERQEALSKLRDTIKNHLPKGFKECMQYNMISYVVPHSIYPEGYHCNPKDALPFISIANQKNFIALHHIGLYASPELVEWFTAEYAKHATAKLDMGKGCVRFKKPEQIPYDVIKALAKKISTKQWIEIYETKLKR